MDPSFSGPSADAELALLLAGTRDRCHVSFRRLVDISRGALRVHVRRYQWNASLIDDILQDTYAAVWDHAGQFDASRGSARGWLNTIARNQAISAFRRTQATVECNVEEFESPADADVPQPPCALLERRHEAHALHGFVRTLKPSQRDAIMLAFYGELTHAEVAHRLHQPLGSVKSDIRRGLLKLRAQLDPPRSSPAATLA